MLFSIIMERLKLSNGNEIPLVGFGTYKIKDANEAYKKGYRAAYNNQDYTTKQAFKDWGSSNLDATTRAFEGLFERAGVPLLDRRKRIAHILSKRYK